MATRKLITDISPFGLFAQFLYPPAFLKRMKETRFKQEWKLTPIQYATMMAERWNMPTPKSQRGAIMMAGAGMMAPVSGGIVVLTNRTITAEDIDPGSATAGARFENDGELWERKSPDGDLQVNGEWWSNEPEVFSIGSDYAVRALSAGKTGTWSASASGDNNWVIISASREWNVNQGTVGTKTTTATFEIGPQPSGPANDSAVITCQATIQE